MDNKYQVRKVRDNDTIKEPLKLFKYKYKFLKILERITYFI